jgi:hypothetical protein
MRALEAFAPPITLIAGGERRAKMQLPLMNWAGDFAACAFAGDYWRRCRAASRRAAARGMDSAKIVAGETLTNALEIAIMRTPHGWNYPAQSGLRFVRSVRQFRGQRRSVFATVWPLCEHLQTSTTKHDVSDASRSAKNLYK